MRGFVIMVSFLSDWVRFENRRLQRSRQGRRRGNPPSSFSVAKTGAGVARSLRSVPAHFDVDDLPEELRTAAPRPRPRGRTQPLEAIEREYILAAVESAGGNRTRAAAELGIGLATLRRKLRRYEAATDGRRADARRRANR
jgi:transcriptional regulator with GAF, ATPase, and Fis domain